MDEDEQVVIHVVDVEEEEDTVEEDAEVGKFDGKWEDGEQGMRKWK